MAFALARRRLHAVRSHPWYRYGPIVAAARQGLRRCNRTHQHRARLRCPRSEAHSAPWHLA